MDAGNLVPALELAQGGLGAGAFIGRKAAARGKAASRRLVVRARHRALDGGEALAIDPLDHEKCLKAAKDEGWTITQILNTHEHRDHTGGNEALAKAGIDGTLRAEMLEPERFLALAKAFSAGQDGV